MNTKNTVKCADLLEMMYVIDQSWQQEMLLERHFGQLKPFWLHALTALSRIEDEEILNGVPDGVMPEGIIYATSNGNGG